MGEDVQVDGTVDGNGIGSAPRECQYLFRLVEEQGRVLYVSAAVEGGSDTFRLFLGVPPRLQAVPVTDVSRYRDGGTTTVEIAQGGLYAPARQCNEPASWQVDDNENDEMVHRTELAPLDPDHYVISETSQHATIRPK